MNLSSVAMILLAWQLFCSNNKQPQKDKASDTGIFSDEVTKLIDDAKKISDSKCPRADKLGAILEILGNPTIQNIASNLFAGQNSAPPPQENDADVNSEGYRFETPSADSREFFRPIDNIADAEIKHKLYWFYDNWYNK